MDWLLEEFRQAEREWAELPEWAKPIYVPPAPDTIPPPESEPEYTRHPQEDAFRQAFLERLARDLTFLTEKGSQAAKWPCCWITHRSKNGITWLWRFCDQTPDGKPRSDRSCTHWHHRWEVWVDTARRLRYGMNMTEP